MNLKYTKLSKCRICGNDDLIKILDLGSQALTGVFPSIKHEQVTSGPLELVKCSEDNTSTSCGLVQLNHSYRPEELYGYNYGYRSGLNPSMVRHLKNKAHKILRQYQPSYEEVIIDIGSNDGTLLGFYPIDGPDLLGMDPTGNKFSHFYAAHINLISDFFSITNAKSFLQGRKAKVVTSIAMFYDLENPLSFMKEVEQILDNDGVWIVEQHYMPTMIESNVYDTICHEHLEYYGLRQIKWMADRSGLKIIDVEFNEINGGSFSVTLCKKSSSYRETTEEINRIIRSEEEMGLKTQIPYLNFVEKVHNHRTKLRNLLKNIYDSGQTVFGYGASTKGNVILQFCQFTEKDIPFISELNPYKFGKFTPGSGIPIVSEKDAHSMRPDYFLVLPWHFKDFIVEKESDYLNSGGKLIFPLPSIEIVSN